MICFSFLQKCSKNTLAGFFMIFPGSILAEDWGRSLLGRCGVSWVWYTLCLCQNSFWKWPVDSWVSYKRWWCSIVMFQWTEFLRTARSFCPWFQGAAMQQTLRWEWPPPCSLLWFATGSTSWSWFYQFKLLLSVLPSGYVKIAIENEHV